MNRDEETNCPPFRGGAGRSAREIQTQGMAMLHLAGAVVGVFAAVALVLAAGWAAIAVARSLS